VRELQRGELLGGDWRDLVRRVRGVPGGGVFGDGGREQFDCVCFVSGGDVLERDGCKLGGRLRDLRGGDIRGGRGERVREVPCRDVFDGDRYDKCERVCFMPGGVVFDCRVECVYVRGRAGRGEFVVYV
jgi:hypothetical protein